MVSGRGIAKHMTNFCCAFSNRDQVLLPFDFVRLTPFLLVSVFLLHEENHDLSEDLDEINEEIEGVGDEVGISTASLEDDDLSVKHDKAAEDGETKVDVNLEEKLGPEEDVEEPKKDEGAQAGEEGASQVQVLAVGSEECGAGEAGEDDGGEHEGGRHDGRVQVNRHVQEGAQAEAGEESEAEQHREPGGPVLAVVGGHEQAEGQPESEEGQEDASATEDVGEHVDVGAGRGGEHAHGEGGVHILQVATHARLELVIEGVEKVVNSRSNGVSHFILFIGAI